MNLLHATPIKIATERATASFLNYFHLWSWLDNKISHKLSGRKTKTYTSVADFWGDILNEKIVDGDLVHFKEVFLSDWLPRTARYELVGK